MFTIEGHFWGRVLSEVVGVFMGGVRAGRGRWRWGQGWGNTLGRVEGKKGALARKCV